MSMKSVRQLPEILRSPFCIESSDISMIALLVAVSRSYGFCKIGTTSNWRRIRQGNQSASAQSFLIAMNETRVFYERAFPAITQLSLDEQENLFKCYFLKFLVIDNLYRTRKVWGEIKRYFMGSVESCLDTDHPELWLDEGQGGESRQTLINCMNAQVHAQFEVVVPAMTRAQITAKEFHTILALVLCDFDSSSELSDRAFSALDGIRIEVLEDLQRYYKEKMGLQDYSTRLGNLITLNHAVQECISINAEYATLQMSVFDVYAAEEKIRQLCL
ncbi:hypothetical protein PFISCL1PPCAC_22097 [Pristionchus fissidentatus]|uniref:NR LBD domain-containing protein n=1 Tax=Pristionchus fissidentatus TaxID=1538716 RepID=A0AAV5WGK4_9BILA|nr:hypothetical protein PFISCL1PPCAC_22097 [Pristionchus fissidentatus]